MYYSKQITINMCVELKKRNHHCLIKMAKQISSVITNFKLFKKLCIDFINYKIMYVD